MSDILNALVQALTKKKQQQRGVPPDDGFNPEEPWNSAALIPTQIRAAGSGNLGMPAPITPPQPQTPESPMNEALALAEKLKKQRELAASLIPERTWNR